MTDDPIERILEEVSDAHLDPTEGNVNINLGLEGLGEEEKRSFLERLIGDEPLGHEVKFGSVHYTARFRRDVARAFLHAITTYLGVYQTATVSYKDDTITFDLELQE